MKTDYIKSSLQTVCLLLLAGLFIQNPTKLPYLQESGLNLAQIPRLEVSGMEDECNDVFIPAPDTLALATSILPEMYGSESEDEFKDSLEGLATIALSSVIASKNAKYTKTQVLTFLASGKTLERAYESSIVSGIPVSVLLAQVILESDLGNSGLTQATGNRGNIKCRCNRRPTLRKQHATLNSRGETVCVQGYDKIEKSNDWYEVVPTDWQDWSKRVRLLMRYKVVRRAKGKGYDWYRYAQVLHDSPYATDKNYATKLRNIIRAYNLNGLDDLVAVNIVSDSGKWIFWNGAERISNES